MKIPTSTYLNKMDIVSAIAHVCIHNMSKAIHFWQHLGLWPTPFLVCFLSFQCSTLALEDSSSQSLNNENANSFFIHKHTI